MAPPKILPSGKEVQQGLDALQAAMLVDVFLRQPCNNPISKWAHFVVAKKDMSINGFSITKYYCAKIENIF